MSRLITLNSWSDWGDQWTATRSPTASGLPLVPGPVYAYRGFGSLGDDGLHSMWGDGNVWKPGWNVSKCTVDIDHSAPVNDCGCGFYGVSENHLDRVAGWSPVAKIEYSGRVVEHQTGYRGERARIVRLVHVISDPLNDQSWKHLARIYGADKVYVWDIDKRDFNALAVLAILNLETS